MAKLSPSDLTKNIDRVNVLKEILTTGGFLYKVGEITKKKVIANDPRNIDIIKVLKKASISNLSIIKNDLKGKEIFFENSERGISLSNIEKDSRFVEINLGHTFEMIFAAAAIAAIKLRPISATSKSDMPKVTENDVKEILVDITNKKTQKLSYEAPAFSLINGTHNDLLNLNYSKNSIAYKGVEKFIKDIEEYKKKKDKLITPVLQYVNSPEILTLRNELFYNGVVDNYIVEMVGEEQQKPDVRIIIKRGNKKVAETKLISLKLNSMTFGSVKGGDEKNLKILFSKFNLDIKIPKSIKENKVVYAYEQAIIAFNNMTLDKQLNAIQFALNQFYAGSQVIQEGFEVLKFTKNKTAAVYKRLFEQFTEKYTERFASKKMKAELSTTNSGFSLIFKLPDNKGFLRIRNRVAEGNIRHEIEEMAGIQGLIGTTSL